MKKKFTLILASIVFLISCSGLLWDGTPDYSGESLTVSIVNPFYQRGTELLPTSKALALQGKYLYIELALISDLAAYNADSLKVRTGNGTWIETDWGGHAILAFDLNNWTQTVEARFKNVPKGTDLQARVIQDVDALVLDEGINVSEIADGYEAGVLDPPICTTFNPNAEDVFLPVGEVAGILDQCWITVPSQAISQSLIHLPLRPYSIDSTLYFSTEVSLTEDYQTLAYVPVTKPAIGETKFTYISPEVVPTFNVRDIAYYSLVSGSLQTPISTIPSMSILYDSDGTPFPIGSPSVTLDIEPPYQYRLLQVHATTLPDYNNPGYFLGSTLFSQPTDMWDVSFGVLFDTYLDLNFSVFPNYAVVTWDLPLGIQSNDLVFKVIETNIDVSGDSTKVETIENLDLLGRNFETGWLTEFTYDSNEVGQISSGSNRWIIILAKHAGASDSDQFIFATRFI